MQGRHKHGLPFVGVKGTVVFVPQLAQITSVSSKDFRPLPWRTLRQLLQTLGSFV